MRRREFITVLGGAAAWPLTVTSQQPDRVRRIGVLISIAESDPMGQVRLAAFREGLSKLGWTDGINIRIEPRWFDGDAGRATRYAKELVDLGPDLIVANATVGIEAVLKATRTIPIVFVLVGNPVGSGFVASVARPGGNVTGFSAFEPEITGKWMQILKQVVPTVKQVAVLSYPGYEFLWREAETSAVPLALQAMQMTCHTTAEIEPAIATVAGQANRALIVLPAPLFASNRDLIIGLAAMHKLPTMYPFRYFAAAGGLMSYGIHVADIFRRAASYVDRILKGSDPGKLPVQAPTRFELVINLKTAKALGLMIPPALLALADEVLD
jgi:putative tryptophan/tyrosine transport system substrate-binding protein